MQLAPSSSAKDNIVCLNITALSSLSCQWAEEAYMTVSWWLVSSDRLFRLASKSENKRKRYRVSFGQRIFTRHAHVSGYILFNPIPTRGGWGTLCPPPQVHFLKYLRNALSYGLETFWQLKWIKLKNKNLFFNRLRPPLVTIATFKVDACFWKAHFGTFHAKAYQNSMFFATPIKNGRTVVCCETLG